jgi:hypothetical protein
MTEEAKIQIPYVPFVTFNSALDALGHTLPPRLDKSMWPSYSGAIQSQLWSTFKFFGLVLPNRRHGTGFVYGSQRPYCLHNASASRHCELREGSRTIEGYYGSQRRSQAGVAFIPRKSEYRSHLSGICYEHLNWTTSWRPGVCSRNHRN